MDMLDDLLGPDIAALRAVRPDYVRYAQGSFEAMVTPPNPVGLTASERALVARRTAELSGDARLATRYAALPIAPGPRDAAILRHTDLLTLSPGQATRGDIDALRAAGLLPLEIVTLSQIVALVSFQVRVLAGMALLGPAA